MALSGGKSQFKPLSFKGALVNVDRLQCWDCVVLQFGILALFRPRLLAVSDDAILERTHICFT